MKFKFLPALAIGLAIPSSLLLMSNWNGPTIGASGSPAESDNNCTTCHLGTVNSGTGSVAISGIDNYEAGMTYSLTLTVTDASSSKFGFQTIALGDDDSPVGTFAAGMGTELFEVDGNTYIQHSEPAADGMFSVSWTAPTDYDGEVTFYFAGNATNADSKTSGDQVYTSTKSISAKPTGLSNDFADVQFDVYPNPSTNGTVTIAFDQSSIEQIAVYSLEGKEVYSTSSTGQGNVQIDNLETGVYILKATSQNGVISKKFVVK